MRVLVLDANQRSALAATRALARSGAEVITADSTEKTLAGASRFSTSQLTYPCPYKSPDDFCATLPGLTRGAAADVLLPMTEVSTYLVARHRQDYSGLAVPVAEFSAFEELSDKGKLFESAARLDIPIPRTYHVSDPADAAAYAQEIGYPVVLKPYRSRILADGRWLTTSVRIAEDRKSLTSLLLEEDAFSRHPFLVQEHVDGVGQGIFTLYDAGQPLAFFAHRRLRERPPWGGVSVLSESVPIDDRMREIAQQLLGTVRWDGPAMVEFKVARDGTPFLMEINPRFWGSLQLAVDAGIDFPTIACRRAMNQSVDPVSSYRQGQRLRWLLGDLDHLYLLLRYGDTSLAQKAGAICAFLNPGFRHVRYEVNRWGDMRPFWHELREYFKFG